MMRFPPFDAPSHIPSEIPPINVIWPSIDEGPDIIIGDVDGWFVHQRRCSEKPEDAKQVKPSDGGIDTQSMLRTRSGWAIAPNRMHRFARRWIPWGVVILIVAIFLHVLEPVLVKAGILTESLAGSINLGLLDYPILFVFASPFIVFPLLLRIVANVEDVRRQHRFQKNPIMDPVIKVSEFNAGEDVRISVSLGDSIAARRLTGHIRVGLLPPHREALMTAFNGGEGRPPIGLSTPLPKGWMPIADDGSGVGEATPMIVGKGPAQLFHEPMRVSESGPKSDFSPDEEVTLIAPKGNWPGSMYGPLVNVNWELFLKVHLSDEKPIYWVERLNAISDASEYRMPRMKAESGRLEID